MNYNKDISIIIPLYNEAESLPELCKWIEQSLQGKGLDYEIIMIDDGSNDKSWDTIKELKNTFSQIKAIRFRRNYGKSAALYKGFEMAEGAIVITMDADLQDSPEEILELRRMILENDYDLVSGWKLNRQDNALTKNLPSKLYNATARLVTGIKLHDMNCGLKAYKNEVVKSIEVYGEMHRYIPYLAKNAGYSNIGEKLVAHQKRKYGVSKFGINRFINGALDLISLWFLSTFAKKPMHFFGFSGILMFLIGFCVSVYLIAEKLYKQCINEYFRPVTEQPLFYIALVSIILGVMLFLSGFLAELISRSSQERNKYNIKDEIK